MRVLLCGATAGSNFGDYLFAKIFQDCASEIVGKKNVYWYRSFGSFSPFFEEHLDNHNKCWFSDIDAMIYISGGYFFGKDKSIKNYVARFVRYCLIGLRCIIHHKPYIIIGMECGPSRSVLIRSIQSFIIKKAKYISVRNTESYEYVKKNIRKDVELTVDTALGIPFDYGKNKADSLAKVKKRLFLHIDNNPDGNRELKNKIIPALNRFLEENPDYTIALSTDQYSENQLQAIDEISSYIKAEVIEKYLYEDPVMLCTILQESDIVITTKLHVGIIAARFGKSVISFSGFTEKIKRFYNQIGELNRTIALSEYDVETGYRMLSEFKDKPICIESNIVRKAESNLEMMKAFLCKFK